MNGFDQKSALIEDIEEYIARQRQGMVEVHLYRARTTTGATAEETKAHFEAATEKVNALIAEFDGRA